MAALLLIVIVAIMLEGAGVTNTVGVLKVWRFPQYAKISIVIGHDISNPVKDLGTWSPPCQFNATAEYRDRISGHTCSYATEGSQLRLEFGSPTQEDGQGRYVCFNGGLDPGARFNCNPSYTTEALVSRAGWTPFPMLPTEAASANTQRQVESSPLSRAKNAAAPGSSSVALLVLLTGLALYVI